VRGSLRSNFSWTLVGNLAYATCQWLLIVVIAKLGSPEMVGRFTLAVAVCSPLMIAAGLGLRTVQANDVGRMRPFGVYLGLRLVTTAAGFGAIAIVAVGGYRAASPVILVYALAKAAESTSEIVWAQLQQQEDMGRIARSMILKGLFAVTAVIVALIVTHDLTVAAAGIAAAWTITLVGYDLVGARGFDQSLRPRFERTQLLSLARTALPLGIVLMVGSYAANAPRYLLDHFGGDRELGLFSANANLMLIGLTLMTALGQAAAPRLARAFLDRNRGEAIRLLRTLLMVAFGLGLCGVVIAAVAGKFALALLYTEDYADRVDVLVVVMLAGMASNIASAFGVTVTASGEYRRQIVLQGLNLVVALAVAWALVPSYGALGAAWALCAASIVTAIVFGLLAGVRLRAL
jgi:O-antigen/teichoic acid export membrane protein